MKGAGKEARFVRARFSDAMFDTIRDAFLRDAGLFFLLSRDRAIWTRGGQSAKFV